MLWVVVSEDDELRNTILNFFNNDAFLTKNPTVRDLKTPEDLVDAFSMYRAVKPLGFVIYGLPKINILPKDFIDEAIFIDVGKAPAANANTRSLDDWKNYLFNKRIAEQTKKQQTNE